MIAAHEKRGAGWSLDDPVERVFGPEMLTLVVKDRKRNLRQRLQIVGEWIETQTFPGIQALETKVRGDHVELINLAPQARLWHQNRIATVETTSRLVRRLCNLLAPVGIAINDTFRVRDTAPYRKVSIFLRAAEYLNLAELCRDLSWVEPGWRGSPTAIGSPEGQSCTMPCQELVNMVVRHLPD